MDHTDCLHQAIRKSGTVWTCMTCGSVVQPGAQQTIPWQRRRWCGLPLAGLVVWAVTLPIAVVIDCGLPLVHWVTGTLGILCHESGHMFAALLCGRPAIPSFDLTYGGGVTWVGERSIPLLLCALGLVAYGAWRLRAVPRLALPLALLLCLQLLLVATGWDQPFGIAMGPGGTVLASGIFIARALTGEADVYPGERWIYGVVGWCMLGDVLGLCWRLTYDAEAVAQYYAGKGGIHNDFVRLAEDWLGTSLAAVVRAAFVVCCLTPCAAIGWCIYRRGIADA